MGGHHKPFGSRGVRRPTAEELYLYRMGSPTISDKRRDELRAFTKLYPHNNASAEKFNAYLDSEWEIIVEKLNE